MGRLELATVGRGWWRLLLAAAIVGALAGYAISSLLGPGYEATATLLVSPRQQAGETPTGQGAVDAIAEDRLTDTFARLATIDAILASAIEAARLDLSVEELRDRLSVHGLGDSQLLEITARGDRAEEASGRANAVADAFVASDEVGLVRTGGVSIIERAQPPDAAVAPNDARNAILGALFLVLVAAGFMALRTRLDDVVRDAESLPALTGGLPLVARVGRLKRANEDGAPSLAGLQPQAPTAEDFRVARTNLMLSVAAGENTGRLFVITSPSAGEGKSTVTANLGAVFGLAGHRVAVVDADLRGPTQHRLFGLPNRAGLTNLLHMPEPDPDLVTQSSGQPTVDVITSGPLPLNPSELLGSERMQEILGTLRERYDIVLIDSPPVLDVTDPAVLAASADSVVLVLRSGRTRRREVTRAVSELSSTGAPLRLVLNDVGPNERRAAYYGARVASKQPVAAGGAEEQR